MRCRRSESSAPLPFGLRRLACWPDVAESTRVLAMGLQFGVPARSPRPFLWHPLRPCAVRVMIMLYMCLYGAIRHSIARRLATAAVENKQPDALSEATFLCFSHITAEKVKMPKSCIAVGCSNHNLMNREGLSLNRFPDREKNTQYWKLWVQAMKRVNEDGSPWAPGGKCA